MGGVEEGSKMGGVEEGSKMGRVEEGSKMGGVEEGSKMVTFNTLSSSKGTVVSKAARPFMATSSRTAPTKGITYIRSTLGGMLGVC